MNIYGKAIAAIENSDSSDNPQGGFTAVLSTASLDRDGERVLRDEWIEPLPDRVPLDVDHGMKVVDTIGSFRPYFDEDGRLMMDASFASTPKAQEARTLVKEGHINTVSVAFLRDKSAQKDGKPHRELLNAGLVAVPANREAVILDSKALDERAAELAAERIEAKDTAPYGDVEYADPGYLDADGNPAKDGNGQKRYPVDTEKHVHAAWSYIHQQKNADQYTAEQLDHIKSAIRSAAKKFGIELEAKSLDLGIRYAGEVTGAAVAGLLESLKTKASGGDAALVQAIHDASCHLGADCVAMQSDSDDTNKSTGLMVVTKGVSGSVEDLQSRICDALRELCGPRTYPWPRATFLSDATSGTVVYSLDSGDAGVESGTFARDFTDDGVTVTLSDEVREVSLITTVAEVSEPDDKMKSFEKKIDEITKFSSHEAGTPQESPAESPAEAPAPAEKAAAAVKAADGAAESQVAVQKRAQRMELLLFASES